MFFAFAKHPPRIVAELVLMAFLVLVFFGASAALWMHMNEQGQMSGCLFSGMLSICPMSFFEHLAAWQSLLSAIENNAPSMPLLIAGLLALVFIVFLGRNIFDELLSVAIRKWELSAHDREFLVFPNILSILFSRGILHPKIY